MSNNNYDDHLIEKMGYKPTLYRGLGTLMNFSFGFTEVAVLSSICITFGVGLAVGGPSVIIWGFIANFFFTMIISLSLAEICSAYPSAGSVYHWTGQLSPEKWAPLYSYICGWLNFLGNGAGDASFANGWTAFLSAGLVASGHQPLSAEIQVAVSIGVLFLWSLMNCARIDQVGWLNGIAAAFQMFSIFFIFAVLLSLTPSYSSANDVFFQFINNTSTTDDTTGFSMSYIVAAGLTTALFSFAGYEASAHMAEETQNSSESAPKGIIYTCLATGIGGLFVLFALLFSFNPGNIDDSLLLGTGNSVADIFIYVTGSKWGEALTWIIVINLFFAGMSSVAVTGRITYALCRDNAFMYSDFLKQVNPTFKSPINAIMFVFLFDALFLLLPLNEKGSLAFYSIIGLATFGFQTSYGIPVLLKLIYPQPHFPNTKMNLGIWSIPIGIISVTWLFGTACLLFLPLSSPVEAESMNWLVVVVSGVFLLMAINWFISGQYHFKGPKRHTGEESEFKFSNLMAVDRIYDSHEVVPTHDSIHTPTV